MTNETPPTRIERVESDLRVLEAVVEATLAEVPRERLSGILTRFDLERNPLAREIRPKDSDQYDAVHRVLNKAHEFVEMILNAGLGDAHA